MKILSTEELLFFEILTKYLENLKFLKSECTEAIGLLY
jgi:hypothetical protein